MKITNKKIMLAEEAIKKLIAAGAPDTAINEAKKYYELLKKYRGDEYLKVSEKMGNKK